MINPSPFIFFSGLAFFFTGCTAIFIRLSNKTKYEVFSKFSFLAGFFIFRGIAMWEHLFFPLYFYQLTQELFIVNLGHRLLTAISALFLLAFAFEICILLNKKLRFLRGVFFVSSLAFFIYIFIYPAGTFFNDIINWSITIESISERFILLPAGVIASIGIYIYSNKLHMPKISLNSLRFFAFALLFYVLHAGLFISKNKHFSPKTYIDVFFELTGFNLSFIEIVLVVLLLCSIFISWYFTNREEERQHLEVHDGMLLCNEHDRIAHDLHDGVIQTLYGLSLQLRHLTTQVDKNNTESSNEYLKENLVNIQQELACSIVDIRDYIYNNISKKPQYEDIAKGIEGIIAELNKITTIQLNFAYENTSDINLSKNVFMNTYFIAREAIINIIKHSDATKAEINLSITQDNLFLLVKDNGKGFQEKHSGGLGLACIADRIEKLHGSFEVFEQQGVHLKINIPLGGNTNAV